MSMAYATTLPTDPVQSHGCWLTTEPLVAGPDAPHMRGTFCMQPAAEFLHSGFSTVIFDFTSETASQTPSR
jgi:hypothetical protein